MEDDGAATHGIVGHGVAILHPHAGAREAEGVFKVLLKLGAHDGHVVGAQFLLVGVLGNCAGVAAMHPDKEEINAADG
jgi:hypothetical protein